MAKKIQSNKESKEKPLTPTAKAYIKMVEESISRMESEDKISAAQRRYIDSLKENLVQGPIWFRENKPSPQFAKHLIQSGITDTVIIQAAKETKPQTKTKKK